MKNYVDKDSCSNAEWKRWVLRRDLNVSLEVQFLRSEGNEVHDCGLQKTKARSDITEVDRG